MNTEYREWRQKGHTRGNIVCTPKFPVLQNYYYYIIIIIETNVLVQNS
jgi:hypothetical protein